MIRLTPDYTLDDEQKVIQEIHRELQQSLPHALCRRIERTIANQEKADLSTYYHVLTSFSATLLMAEQDMKYQGTLQKDTRLNLEKLSVPLEEMNITWPEPGQGFRILWLIFRQLLFKFLIHILVRRSHVAPLSFLDRFQPIHALSQQEPSEAISDRFWLYQIQGTFSEDAVKTVAKAQEMAWVQDRLFGKDAKSFHKAATEEIHRIFRNTVYNTPAKLPDGVANPDKQFLLQSIQLHGKGMYFLEDRVLMEQVRQVQTSHRQACTEYLIQKTKEALKTGVPARLATLPEYQTLMDLNTQVVEPGLTRLSKLLPYVEKTAMGKYSFLTQQKLPALPVFVKEAMAQWDQDIIRINAAIVHPGQEEANIKACIAQILSLEKPLQKTTSVDLHQDVQALYEALKVYIGSHAFVNEIYSVGFSDLLALSSSEGRPRWIVFFSQTVSTLTQTLIEHQLKDKKDTLSPKRRQEIATGLLASL